MERRAGGAQPGNAPLTRGLAFVNYCGGRRRHVIAAIRRGSDKHRRYPNRS
jgi:hypothetical protein